MLPISEELGTGFVPSGKLGKGFHTGSIGATTRLRGRKLATASTGRDLPSTSTC